jgi:hypothetical protein
VGQCFFSSCTLDSSTKKSDRQDITEILLKVALITIKETEILVGFATNAISCTCVLEVSSLPFSTILIFDLGIVPTGRYCLLFHFIIKCVINLR